MRTQRRGTLTVLPLEDRATPAVFTVTTTADNGNDAAPTAGSLRAAIVAANAAPGMDTINFAIPGGGVQTIAPPGLLPNVTDAVVIDGTTQFGYAVGAPTVRLSGATAPNGTEGLVLFDHVGSVVKGLAIGGFRGAGVRIVGGGQHQIQNNLIGVNPTGTAADANAVGVGIAAGSSQNVIGGTQDTRNVISGNTFSGVEVIGTSTQNTVAANYIGVGGNGVTPIPNGADGVLVRGGATFTTVGGAAAGVGNIIAANGAAGVHVMDAATAGTLIQGNRIGLDFSGTASGNAGDGVRVDAAAGTAPANGLAPPTTNTTIRGNTIQQNKGNGVNVLDTARYVRIVTNTIANNAGLGIAVAATANDGLAAPTLDTIKTDSVNGITVTGTVTGRPNTAYEVTLYTASTADPSGFGEGETKGNTAAIIVSTNAAGTATFTGTIPPALSAPFVSATVTATTAGDTSAFAKTLARPAAGLDGRLAFVAAGAGAAPQVALVNQTGATVLTLTVFESTYTGGVRVAAGDFNLDGVPDVVAGTGPGGPTRVRIIDPVTQKELFSTQPFEASFTGGVYVSTGDLTGDGVADLIITPDEGGGPRVRVFNGRDFSLVADFFGINDPNFRGGARTATGDVNGDGRADLIVAAGFGGGPRVSVYNGTTVASGAPANLFNDFFAFEQTLRNGVFIAAGDINDDGFAEVIAGGGPGGGPRVLALSGKSLLSNQNVVAANFFAGDPTLRGGVRVAARDLNFDGSFEVMAGDGPGGGGVLRVYTGSDLTPSATNPDPRVNLAAFPAAAGGVYVG